MIIGVEKNSLNIHQYTGISIEDINENILFLGFDIGDELIQKLSSFKYPIAKLDDENNLIDIVEDEDKLNHRESNYTVIEDKPSETEIQFAEYILATEDRIKNLENNILGGI